MRLRDDSRLADFRKEIKVVGSSFKVNKINAAVIDTFIQRLSMHGGPGQYYFFCGPRFAAAIYQYLDDMNAHAEAYGTFSAENETESFISERAFSRGSYEFYVIAKPINGAIITPASVLIEEAAPKSINVSWG